MKNEIQRIGIIGCALLISLSIVFGWQDGWLSSLYWLLQAGLVWVFVYRFALQRQHLNRESATAPLYQSLGWGNRLTLLRGGLIALTAGFILQTENINGGLLMAAACYTVAAILDRIDGWVARRSRQTSLLGIELDIGFDALGLVVAPLLAISLGKLHVSYLLLSAAYYIYQWGLAARRRRGLPIFPTVPNPLRRTLAGLQMGFIAAILWPPVAAEVARIAGMAFMLPVLLGFILDWLVVCGYINPHLPVIEKIVQRLQGFARSFFLPLLRLLVALLVFLILINAATPIVDVMDIFLACLVLATLAVLLGFVGRIGALVLLLLISWQYPSATTSVEGCLLILCLCALALFGSGRFSLWQWDDRWVNRYDGA
ncbi:MAG TPA: CDP-alcohol phosphatidyltransferase family protein [Cellvibrio sp.]|nr:CDP-alcohol phosphatidyltransferase family protein [Cellvibrio sp.]